MAREKWERRYSERLADSARAAMASDSPTAFAQQAAVYFPRPIDPGRHSPVTPENDMGRAAAGYFPRPGRILDLGAGTGRDSRYFAGLGYEVVSTDFAEAALKLNRANTPGELSARINVLCVDLRSGLPFEDASFDVVYAHMSLHYFSEAATLAIMGEVRRVLRTDGVFAFMVNSTGSPEYGNGPKIEDDYFYIVEEDGEGPKRYFSVESARRFTAGSFQELLLDDMGEADFKARRGVHGLVRFIGKKA